MLDINQSSKEEEEEKINTVSLLKFVKMSDWDCDRTSFIHDIMSQHQNYLAFSHEDRVGISCLL